jgi:hypothetical protein
MLKLIFIVVMNLVDFLCQVLCRLLSSICPVRDPVPCPERGSRVVQILRKTSCGRMRAPEHAARGPLHFLERRHGLAEIFERGGGVEVERLSVKRTHIERECITFSENTPCHRNRFAQQCPGFFEAL